MDQVAPIIAQAGIAVGSPLVIGIISLLAGLLILFVPRVLNYVVAVYLIIVGVLWIMAAI